MISAVHAAEHDRVPVGERLPQALLFRFDAEIADSELHQRVGDGASPGAHSEDENRRRHLHLDELGIGRPRRFGAQRAR
jgi:hypothetical protein